MSEITAYEKMFKDGSAFKKFDMQKIQNQQYAEAGISERSNGRDVSQPLGDPIRESHMEEDHTDWSAVDEAMQKRMDALRAKAKGGSTKQPVDESLEIKKLKRRVKQLEEAMMLIMETHEKLLGD